MEKDHAHGAQDERSRADRVRWLVPETTQVFEGTFSLLHCAVRGDTLYRAVFAIKLFPINHPDRYISLRYTDREDTVYEIGVIEDLNVFPKEARELIRTSLSRQYYEQIIYHIHEVKYRYGLLFFDVETQRGREEFIMSWSYDRAQDYSRRGKVLVDVFDNRFIIPDVSALAPADRRRLRRYIYW